MVCLATCCKMNTICDEVGHMLPHVSKTSLEIITLGTCVNYKIDYRKYNHSLYISINYIWQRKVTLSRLSYYIQVVHKGLKATENLFQFKKHKSKQARKKCNQGLLLAK